MIWTWSDLQQTLQAIFLNSRQPHFCGRAVRPQFRFNYYVLYRPCRKPSNFTQFWASQTHWIKKLNAKRCLFIACVKWLNSFNLSTLESYHASFNCQLKPALQDWIKISMSKPPLVAQSAASVFSRCLQDLQANLELRPHCNRWCLAAYFYRVWAESSGAALSRCRDFKNKHSRQWHWTTPVIDNWGSGLSSKRSGRPGCKKDMGWKIDNWQLKIETETAQWMTARKRNETMPTIHNKPQWQLLT